MDGQRERAAGDGVAGLAGLEEAPPKALRWRRLIIGALVGMAGGVAAIALLEPGIWRQLLHGDVDIQRPAFLVLAVLAAIGAYTADVLTFVVLVRRVAPRAPRRQVGAISLEGTMVGGVSSFGGLEVPYRILMLRTVGVPGSLAAAAAIFKGMIRATPLALLGLIAVLPTSHSPLDAAQRTGVVVVASLFALIWGAAWYLVRRPHHAALLPGWLRHRAAAALQALHAYHSAGAWFWARLLLLQVAYWAGMFAIIPLSLYALGWRGQVLPVIMGQAVVQLLMPFSPLPGGAAVAEVTFLALIAPSASPLVQGASLVLWRLLTWVGPVFIGIVVLAVRQLHRSRSAAGPRLPAAVAKRFE